MKTQTEIEHSLHELGQRLRAGWAKKHAVVPEKSIETVRDTVREQWEQEQQISRDAKPEPEAPKEPQKQPDEPEVGS